MFLRTHQAVRRQVKKMTNEPKIVEIRMPMTGNETLSADNEGNYDVRASSCGDGTDSHWIQYRVKQVYGSKPAIFRDTFREAFLLQEHPIRQYGLFTVQKYDYNGSGPKSHLKTVGIRFTNIGAHNLAHKLAIKCAQKIAHKEQRDLVDRVEEDTTTLRRQLKEIRTHNTS